MSPKLGSLPKPPVKKNRTEEKVTVRIGRIRYTNVLPFFHRFTNEEASKSGMNLDLKFISECPAELNRLMAAGELDMAPISSLAYTHYQHDLLLLPDLAISARDFSGSVILFSKDRIEGLNGKKIAVSLESLSSTTLLKILLKFKYKFQNEFVPFESNPEKMLKQHPACLLIGDDALFYHPKDFVYKYDLSELWWNWTGKPFCFSVWAVRKGFAESYPEEITWLTEFIQKNRDRNLIDIEQLLKDSMNLTFTDDKFSKLFGYLFNLHYGFDSPLREGLELFYRLTERLGVAHRPKELEFLALE